MPVQVTIDSLVKEVNGIHSTYPTWTKDNAFVHWFLQAFLVPDLESSAKAVTGASHDKGVDAVFIDDRLQQVFLVQGKFHAGPKPPHENRSNILSFAQLAQKVTAGKAEYDMFSNKLDPDVKQRLDEARTRITRRQYRLNLYYVTTGKCSGALKSEAEAEAGQANAKTEMSVLDRPEVLALLEDYIGGAAPPVPYLDLIIDPRGVIASDGMVQRYDGITKIESWIFSMSGTEIARLYERAGDRLFARNIRGFLGDTAINAGMRKTLEDDPGHFWYFNNGITIVCDSARKTAEKGRAILRVTNPQVINGQQTTRTLHLAPTREAAVLVRVIMVPRSSDGSPEKFEKLVSTIVASTNWQNAILHSDLRSNDVRQVALQRDLAKIKYHYLRKRQTKKEAKRQLGSQHWFRIKKDELAQVVAAANFDPVVVRRGKEGLFQAPYYDKIFDGRSIREYLSIYWLARLVKNLGSGYPDRAYAKWLVLNFMWSQLAAALRARAAADFFRTVAERSKSPEPLKSATNIVYQSVLQYYKENRGSGVHAIDISNFFYRPNNHTKFQQFWNSRKNANRRKRFNVQIERFQDEMSEALET